MFCYHCGKEIEENSRFCFYCGQEQTLPETPVAPAAPVEAPAVPATSIADDTLEIPVVSPSPMEPLGTVAPESLVEELSRMMTPPAAEPPAAAVVEIPDIPEVPVAPVAPVAPAEVMPQPAVQPVAQPVAPTYVPAPAYAPVAAPRQEVPRRKKTWLIWLSVALSVVLVAGAVLGVFLLKGSGHEKAMESLTKVAFEGDFSRIEELAPAEFWNMYSLVISPSQMTYQGDVWKFTILPTKLQQQFGSKTSMHYDSFRMPSSMETRSDQEATALEAQSIKAVLAVYGISGTRVDEVRKLQVEITITGMSNGIKQELCQPETLFAVEIDGKWYLLSEDGTFAVNEVVEEVLGEIK